MFPTARTVRAQIPSLVSPFSVPKLSITGKTAGVRFSQAVAGPNESNKMDKRKQEPKSNTGDIMSNSFGEAYASRSEEEGFGGIYGKNQSLSKNCEDKVDPGNSHEFDGNQGSEVKEKESARNQKKVASQN